MLPHAGECTVGECILQQVPVVGSGATLECTMMIMKGDFADGAHVQGVWVEGPRVPGRSDSCVGSDCTDAAHSQLGVRGHRGIQSDEPEQAAIGV